MKLNSTQKKNNEVTSLFKIKSREISISIFVQPAVYFKKKIVDFDFQVLM